jgi:hypothetical protein
MVRHTGEDFIDVESIAVASVISLQSTGVRRPKLDAPEPNRFATGGYASFSQEVFNIPVAEIESVVEPDSVADDIWRESMSLVGIHPPTLSILLL